MSEHDDLPLRDALRDRISDLGHSGAVIVGYAAVVEVITPEEGRTWLKVLADSDSQPWQHVGRVVALQQIMEGNLSAGWEGDE